MKTVTVAQARQIDAHAVEVLGMPSILLMENAAIGVAEAARRFGNSWVVLCGPGNNGGDGLAAARHLGRCCAVFLMAEPDPQRSPDAALQLDILRRAGHPVVVGSVPEPASYSGAVWIDAMFGTGLSRGLEGEAADWVGVFNRAEGPKLSVDIPSGLDGDTGEPLGATCRADRTVTLAAAKVGLVQPAAHDYVGSLEVVGLGIPG